MSNLTLHHESNGTHIRDAAGGLVASLEAGSQEKRDRDGAQIVSACNSHDPMREALQDAIACFEARIRGAVLNGEHERIGKMRAALKLAKGET